MEINRMKNIMLRDALAAAVGDVGEVGSDLGSIKSSDDRPCTPSSRDTLLFRKRPRRIRFSWNS